MALVVLIVIPGCIWLHFNTAPLDRFDTQITDAVVALRSGWLDRLARATNSLASRGGLAILGLAAVACAAWFRRWRHLLLFLFGLLIIELALWGLVVLAARPRPFSVTIIGSWEGYSAPSVEITVLAAILVGATYMLVVPGRPRNTAKVVSSAILLGAGLLRIYLGVDHSTDVSFAAILGVSIPVALYRAYAPNDLFPVRYGARGKAAHLDVTGRRGEAIRIAMAEQLGFDVTDIKPVGLEGSGGSTPLKLRVVDDRGRPRSVFAKLYASSHVRADRWYKLGRTMMYGRLEDETPFATVRRFVEYEDYTLRLLGEYGFPTPEPLGIVEITPEREYLIAMEFFDDAVEIGEASIDERAIDDGLHLIRRMWDVGLAHRDIKPANLMVQAGRLRLIDVFFVQVRPSPWRQAVDLGNMMLVLALRSDAQTVYQRALAYFTAEELSEAFAATRGVASPTQLQKSMKADGRGLLEEFRALAPPRRPIAVQRWSVRRVLLILGTLTVVILALAAGVSLFLPTVPEPSPDCGTGRAMRLMAQAVPTATQVPCVEDLPVGWAVAETKVVRGNASFILGTGEGSANPVTITLTETCAAEADDPSAEATPFEGGCVTYQTSVPAGSGSVPSFAPGGGLRYVDRADLVSAVAAEEGLVLCGADAPPCPPD